jgi:hypothetical protein
MTSEIRSAASAAIDAQRGTLAEATVAEAYCRRVACLEGSGARGRTKCVQDTAYHLSFLADAVGTDCLSLFTAYLGWAKALLTQLGFHTDALAENLQCMRGALQQLLPQEFAELACACVDEGLQRLPQLPVELPSCVGECSPLAPLATAYLEALLRGDRQTASRLILDAVRSGTPVRDIYLQVFECSQHEMGRLWQMNKITVAQEHHCSAATQMIMSLL